MLYVSCILSVLFLAYIADRREDRFCLFLCAFILSLFCGVRSVETGVDTNNYYIFMSYIRGAGISYGSDIGFSVFAYVLMGFLKNPYHPLVIFAFITNYLIVYRIWDFRKEASFTLMMLLYVAIYFPYTLNIVRQFLAIAIVFWGTRYIEREEYVKYIVLNILASTMHSSALICFIFLFLNSARNKYKVLGFGMAVCCVLGGIVIFNQNIVKYKQYFLDTNLTIHAMTILKILCVLFIMLFNKMFKNKEFSVSKDGILIPIKKIIPIMYLTGLLLATLGMKFKFMNRIGFYFTMFELPFWGQVVRARVNKREYQFVIFMIIGYFLFSSYLSGDNADNLFYYHSFLMK